MMGKRNIYRQQRNKEIEIRERQQKMKKKTDYLK